MENQSRLKTVIAAALVCTVLVTLSVLFVDRPVAILVWKYVLVPGPQLLFFDAMASPSLFPMPGAVLYLIIHTLRSVSGRPASPRAGLYLRLSVAIAVAIMAKDEFKWLFGRPWPATWVRYGDYRLHPFNNGLLFGGFPSGHTTYIAAPMFVLWAYLPKHRPLWLAILFSVMIGLVASGHHFVGDVIAGCFLGMAAAAGTLAIWPKEGVVFSKRKSGRHANQEDFLNPRPGRQKIRHPISVIIEPGSPSANAPD